MRVLVTGSRDWPDPGLVEQRLDALLGSAIGMEEDEFVVVHGSARGVDTMAHDWAYREHLKPQPLEIKMEPHPAQWRLHTEDCPEWHKGMETCKMAGHRRNALMVELGADWCLAFRLDNSPGTTSCIRLAEAADIRTHIDDRKSLTTSAGPLSPRSNQ